MKHPYTAEKHIKDDYQIIAEVDLPGTVDEVWELLTKAEEITKWFPPNAKIEPEVGGIWAVSWHDQFSWIDRITELEEGKRIVLKPFLDDDELEKMGIEVNRQEKPFPYALEFTLTGKGGSTTLRLVQSGFLNSKSWEDEVDSYLHGWRHQFYSLVHWMTNHRKEKRTFVRGNIQTPGNRVEIWEKIVGGKNSIFQIGHNEAGKPEKLFVNLDGKTVARGELLFYKADKQLIANLSDHNDSLFAFGIWSKDPNQWLVSDINFFGATQEEADLFASKLEGAFKAATSS